MKRILFYTGKGGVGKTSVAAATALRSASMGYRTVVLSTDSAHSLSDSFETKLGPEPVEVAPNLWGQEVDVYYSIQKYWDNLEEYLASLFSWQGVDQVVAEELASIADMDEGASLLWINQHFSGDDFDVIVVDSAPTAETLRLLSLPQAGRWWFDHLFPLGKRATLVLGPIASPLLDNMPMPTKDTLDASEQLFKQLDHLYKLLTDPSITSVRLVLNPEKMVIKEAQRTYTYLNLYGYNTDMVVANRVFSDEVGAQFGQWHEIQAKYLQMIKESFDPVPIVHVPYFENEVVGLEMLDRMAEVLYPDQDPTAILHRGKSFVIEPLDGGYRMDVPLPFVTNDQVSLLRVGDELTIQVGGWRRNMLLPHALRGTETAKAHLDDSILHIDFKPLDKEVTHA